MSRDINSQPLLPPSEEEQIAAQPWSIETYADHLMDELFDDVDRILDGGTPPSNEASAPEYGSFQPVGTAALALPPMIASRSELMVQPGQALDDLLSPPPQKSVSQSSAGDWITKLLLGLTCLSLVAIAGLLVAQKRGLYRLVADTSPVQTPSPLVDPKVEADNQFISYMQKSLEVLDQKSAEQRATPSPGLAANNLPPLGQPVPTTAGILPTVPVASNPPPLGKVPPANSVYLPGSPGPQAAPSVTTVPLPPAVTPNKALPVAPAPVIVASPAPAAPLHTLVGVLDLGNRSAALFEMNGTTQRINIGEAIGTSGWTLVKISRQEAMIRRNGEVRSVYVGQKF